MKKCPFCAEDVQDEAIKCKHCNSELTLVLSNTDANNHLSRDRPNSKKEEKGGGIAKFIFILLTWYISLPFLAFRYVWKRNGWSKLKKILASVAIGIVAVGFISFVFYKPPMPVIVVTEPTEEITPQSTLIHIKGTYSPTSAKFQATSGTGTVHLKKDETFIFDGQLKAGENIFVFKLSNDTGEDTATVKVMRPLSEEEELQRVAELEKQKQIEEKKKAEELAKQKAWEQSKAGQICKEHPEWSKDDCERIADNQIWIGMESWMLVEERGKPNSANPSNYGSGTEWQWCWYDYTPSCFYGDDDGIIDSYN